MMHRQFPLFLLLFLLPLAWGGAQSSARSSARSGGDGETLFGPEEPEIIAPELVLEIEDVGFEDIAAPLPPASQLPLPDFKLPSPEAEMGELEIVTVNPEIPELRMALPEDDADFFSEALVGGGINNSLLGDISLYKLGDGPRFSLRFLHDGKDGYSGEAPGAGFFHRTDQLEADVRMKAAGDFSMEASYGEKEQGLQGRMNDARSFIRRSSFIHLLWRSPDTSDLLFSLGGSYRDTTALFAGAGEAGIDELFIHPTGEFRYLRDTFSAALRGDYRFHGFSGDGFRHLLDATLLLDLELPFMDIGLSGGVLWDLGQFLRYPFSLSVNGGVGTFLTYSSLAGFRVETPLWYDYWEKLPYLAGTTLPSMQEQWFWQGSLEWKILNSLALRGGWFLSYGDRPVGISSFAPDLSGGGPLLPLDGSGIAFSGEGLLVWTIIPDLLVGAGYAGWWGAAPGLTDQPGSISTFAEYGNGGGDISGRMDLIWNFLSEEQIPVLDLSFSWILADGIQTILEGRDLLEPFLEGGRKVAGPFIGEGAGLSLRMKISL